MLSLKLACSLRSVLLVACKCCQIGHSAVAVSSSAIAIAASTNNDLLQGVLLGLDFCKCLLVLVKLVLRLVGNALYIAVQSVKVDLRYISCISRLRSKGVVPVVLGGHHALDDLQQAIGH